VAAQGGINAALKNTAEETPRTPTRPGLLQFRGKRRAWTCYLGSAALGKRVPLYPDFVLRQGLLCVWGFGLLLTAAILWPTSLRPEGDLMAAAPEGITPEWYFLAAFEIIKWDGHLTFLTPIGITAELLSLILFGVGMGVFVLIPILDTRGPGHLWRWGIRLTALGLFQQYPL
ncbi:MAG: hypothetical protein GY809_20730, partial [Planctomycetes bacterium]|nr:hypothetical protein [Planctomycetota bacterium]